MDGWFSFIFILLVIYLTWKFVLTGLSKLTNTTIIGGGGATRPEDWDDMIGLFKNSAQNFGNLSRSTINKLKSLKQTSTMDKTEKISKLLEIKEKGEINQEEYELLKKDIIGDR